MNKLFKSVLKWLTDNLFDCNWMWVINLIQPADFQGCPKKFSTCKTILYLVENFYKNKSVSFDLCFRWNLYKEDKLRPNKSLETIFVQLSPPEVLKQKQPVGQWTLIFANYSCLQQQYFTGNSYSIILCLICSKKNSNSCNNI